MKQNQMYPRWSNKLEGSQANTHVCTWTDIKITTFSESDLQTLSSETKADQWSRQHLSTTGSSTWFFHQNTCICLLGLLVISAQTHCSYCNSSPDQALESRMSQILPMLKGEEEANAIRSLWHLLALKTAALNISSSPYWSTSKVRKSMVVGWGLGFPVDNIGKSMVKRSTWEYISMTTELEKMIRKEKKKITERVKKWIMIHL